VGATFDADNADDEKNEGDSGANTDADDEADRGTGG
jgi:hypothetical protein